MKLSRAFHHAHKHIVDQAENGATYNVEFDGKVVQVKMIEDELHAANKESVALLTAWEESHK